MELQSIDNGNNSDNNVYINNIDNGDNIHNNVINDTDNSKDNDDNSNDVWQLRLLKKSNK